MRAQDGNTRAVEWIIDQFSGVVEIECSRIGLNKQPEWSQSDLHQEVWIQILNKLNQFNETKNENVDLIFKNWLRITARSVLSNILRRNSAKKTDSTEWSTTLR